MKKNNHYIPYKWNSGEEHFIFHPLRGLYWENQNLLLMADLHFGKVAHFRKEGIYVPQEAERMNYKRFEALLQEYKGSRVILLGDVFHSDVNKEWMTLHALMNDFPDIEVIPGNHDRYTLKKFEESPWTILQGNLAIGSVVLSHEPLPSVKGLLNIHGHLHPAVSIKGRGRQQLTLPCFHYSGSHLCLAAFNEFTGKYIIEPKESDHIFAVTDISIKHFS